ncbi:MAG: cobalamin biosynthesis protein [Aestuariivita sp.]|nr:cobalamin biosynthesis protein [Aestuariivita sp.]
MIIAGFGFRKLAKLSSLLDAYTEATVDEPLDGIATVANKASLCIFEELATYLKLPIFPIVRNKLVIQRTRSWSRVSFDTYNVGSVAEAAALAAAGRNSQLLTQRVIASDCMATCAIAKGYST